MASNAVAFPGGRLLSYICILILIYQWCVSSSVAASLCQASPSWPIVLNVAPDGMTIEVTVLAHEAHCPTQCIYLVGPAEEVACLLACLLPFACGSKAEGRAVGLCGVVSNYSGC